MAIAFIFIHEAAHILTAMTFGARFGELTLGFMRINPSVTLREWFTGTRRTIVHYSGGLAVGATFLLFYLVYWVPKYYRNPNFFLLRDI